MAVDKNKVTAEATRYAQRGQWDRAIKSYERILAEDPKDVRALLKVGELNQKRGDEAAAAATFGRVAEAYSEQGFFLKAIAVYKQMVKLAPDDIRVNERLASLYQQLGIMSDAMAQLQLVAAALERQGDQARLLDVLGRMAEIEPDNVGSAVKLGEIHARAGRTAEALDQFRRAADLLRKANRADEYLRVAERIAFLAPDDMGLTRELANIYLAKGDTKRSLAKLQLCFKADPKDIDTLNLLAQAFRDLGQTTKTLSVYKELAHVYAEKRRADEARATWKKVLELAPGDPDAAAGLAGVLTGPPPPPAPTPGPPPGARPSVIAPPPPQPSAAATAGTRPAAPPAASPAPAAAGARPAAPARALGPEAIPKLLTEADVYVKYGLHQKALDHLRKVFEIDPDHLEAREKARDIRAVAGDATGAAEEAAHALRLCQERGLADRAIAAQARLREIAPAQQSLGGAAEAPPVPIEEVVLIEPELTPAAMAVQEDFLVEDTAVEVDDLALSGVEAGVEEVVEDDEAALAAAGAAEEQVVEEEGPVAGDEPLGPPPSAAPPMAFPAPLRTTPPPGPLPVRLTPPPAPARPTPPPAPPPALTPVPVRRQPVARVEPVRVVVAPPLPAAEAAPPPPSAPAAPAEVAPPPPPPGRSALPPPPVPRIDPAAPPPGDAVPPPLAAGEAEEREEELDLSDEIEEADFFMQQGLFAEAQETLRNLAAFYPGHSQVGEKLVELARREAGARRPSAAAPPPAPPPSGVFDIGKELADELGAEAAPLPAEEFQYTVEEVFSQFKKGVSQVVKAEDTDTHYDLGIAYKEMGLVDDALSEFETALRGAGSAKQVDCLSMIGLCRMALGDAGAAADAFRRALRSEATRPEAARALHYEMAAACQALGDIESSLWYLHKVVRADPTFRDAAVRLKGLGGGPGRAPPEVAPPAAPPAAGGPKKNIGYV